MQKTHELKTWPEYFEVIWQGKKTFELRSDFDRLFQIGDLLHLREWVPCKACGGSGREWDVGDQTSCGVCLGKKTTKGYTGREMTADVTYVMHDAPGFGLAEGFVVMSIVVKQRANASGRHDCETA